MAKVVVEARNLSKRYVMGDQTVHALRNVNVQIFEGDFVAIMGPSGSGKSTFMNLIGCLDRPSDGECLLDENPVANMSDNQLAHIRNKYIGFVFQNFNLLPRTTALKNVALPLMYAGIKDRDKPAKEALELVGLGARMDHTPSELSGGQQQRVAIARAIVNNPVIILGDEPTGNLDSRTSEEIMAVFQELNRQGKTVIIVTHEEDVAHHCKRVIRFRDGRIQSDGPVENPTDARVVLAGMPNSDAEQPSEPVVAPEPPAPVGFQL